MRSLAVRIDKARRLLLMRLRLECTRVRLGRGSLPAGVRIGAGARLSASDGGVLNFSGPCDIDRFATIIVKYGRVEIGPRTHVGIGAVVVARESITVGADTLIGEYVTIRDQDHEFEKEGPVHASGFRTSAVNIGDNVWIGAKATITRGVSIGSCSIIAAGAVVTSDVPAHTVVAGIPARYVRTLVRKTSAS